MNVRSATSTTMARSVGQPTRARQSEGLFLASDILWTIAILAFLWFIVTGEGSGTARSSGRWSLLLLAAGIVVALLFG